MKNVTDRERNPFGMRPPFERQGPGEVPAAFGYGDANADFHLIGDHPGVHGGRTTGIPFTETESGSALFDVFRELRFVDGPTERPRLTNLFCSYVHPCVLENGRGPTVAEYDELERFFDAELRAINAHILIPVGERAIDHVLSEYTTLRHRFDDLTELHATEIRGRGFLVVPSTDPSKWTAGDRAALLSRLDAIRRSDYRQTKGVATTVG